MLRNHEGMRLAAISLAVGLMIGLAGCAPGAVVDQLPEGMGLPSDAPARPRTPYKYPAVHDMPPERQTAPLSEAEQLKLEKELQTARDRQEGNSEPAPKQRSAKKKSAPVAKKPPLDIKSGLTSGATTKP